MSVSARLGLAYALVAVVVVGMAGWFLWPLLTQLANPDRPRSFYIPSENMLPTLRVNDRVRPLRMAPAGLRRGMVVVFPAQDSTRVARIVAVGGDVVALRAGRVFIDGHEVQQRRVGRGPTLDGSPTEEFAEHLPGEQGEHRVLDAGPSTGDDFDSVRVPPAQLFVLGDNRDRAADSRFSRAEMGVGLVPTGTVIGVVDRLLWAPGLHDLGKPIDSDTRR